MKLFSLSETNALRVSHGNLCTLITKHALRPQCKNAIYQFSLTITVFCPPGYYLWRSRQEPRDVPGVTDARDHVQVRHTHVHHRGQNTPPSLLHNQALEPECLLTFPSPAGWLWGLYFGLALVLARLRASGSSTSLTGLSFLLSCSWLPLQTHSCGALSEGAVVKSYLRGRDRLTLLKNRWKVTSLFFNSSYMSV